MSVRFWIAPFVLGAGMVASPTFEPPAAGPADAGRPESRSRPRRRIRRRSTIRSIWPSPCTTPTSRSCAMFASCGLRAASASCGSWTSRRPSIPQPFTSDRISQPSQLDVLEQNYEYDLLEPDKLLRKYVGRDVTLVRMRQQDGTTRPEEVTARLLSYNNAPVWQIGNEIITGMHADHIRFPELPENLYARPTLIWTLENDGVEQHRVEAAYLAGKLSWAADYVLNVGRDDKAADLDGWVTLNNGSGTEFRNARLQLVAGDLNRVRQELGRMAMDLAARAQAGGGGADGAGGILRVPPLHA